LKLVAGIGVGMRVVGRPGMGTGICPHAALYCRAFSDAGPTVWNSLSLSLSDFIRDPTINAYCFRRLLKTYLFARCT